MKTKSWYGRIRTNVITIKLQPFGRKATFETTDHLKYFVYSRQGGGHLALGPQEREWCLRGRGT